jgi:lipopolysaccharide export system ATP-binding protein
VLHNTIPESLEQNPSSARPRVGLSVVEVSKKLGGRQVLTRVSLDVGRHEVVGLLGRDGAGKTVSFYCILGLARVDEGQILLDGQDVTDLPLYHRARLGLGYLPEENSIFSGMTVAQNIEAVLELFVPERADRDRRLETLLGEFHLGYVRDTAAGALSGGERRRCEIARAMAATPSILLLDAPFAGLDPLSVSDIKRAIAELKARGVGVLLTDQNVDELLDVLDRVYVIHEGRIVFQGPPDRMLHDALVKEIYLGQAFEPHVSLEGPMRPPIQTGALK